MESADEFPTAEDTCSESVIQLTSQRFIVRILTGDGVGAGAGVIHILLLKQHILIQILPSTSLAILGYARFLDGEEG